MKGSSDAVRSAADRLAVLEKKRTSAIDSSRIITRKTKNMIHAIHVGEDYAPMEKELVTDKESLFRDVGDEPSVLCSAVVQDALGISGYSML